MESLYQQTIRLLSETQRQMHDLSSYSTTNEEDVACHQPLGHTVLVGYSDFKRNEPFSFKESKVLPYLRLLFSTCGESAITSQVWENLQQLEQDCFRLENMARKEVPTRRQEAKHRIDQLLADFRVVQNAYRSFQQRKRVAEQEARQREELLSRRFTPNSALEGDATITMDHSLHHHQQLQDANRGLDNILNHGRDIVTNLKGQGFTLKGVQRKVLDVMNTLGLSNTVMRLIEKRTEQDRYIFWGGILITVTIMALIVWYLL